MKRLIFLVSLASVLTLGGVQVAQAAPKSDNPNVRVVPVRCDGIGDLDVLTMEHSPLAFGPDGEIFVAKRFTGEFAGTITTNDGSVFNFSDSFEEGPKGQGFEDRLVQCSFTETESESFILDAEFAEFVGIPEVYVGTEVTLNATTNGTAWVFVVKS